MSKIVKFTCTSFLYAVIAGIVTFIWWRLWFYKGWYGPPGIVTFFLSADGEGYYNSTIFEMYLISFVLVSFVAIFLKRITS